MKKLFECYSRLLIDNHISDIDPRYMRRFSPEEYVRLVKMSGVDAAMVYACCHNGNCYYPTVTGHMHANLEGRDIFGETISLLRQNNIVPIAYYTATYHNDCARRLPHTKIVSPDPEAVAGRYLYTCPNQRDAVEFYKAQIREIIRYDIDGIFIDMSFWPDICVCDACKAKFGRPLPEKIDWNDPEWMAFQRFRESSMADFAAELTQTVRDEAPHITVTHQFSPVLHGWFLGQSRRIAAVSDYASGDFYGSNLQQRFGVKTFDAFTTRSPYEFMTSRCVNLHDHTSGKSDDELFLSALTTLANGGAYFFIDAINPDGTLNGKFYQRLQNLNQKLLPFKNAVAEKRFSLDAQVGLYFSIECCVDKNLNGRRLRDFISGGANNMQVRQNAVLDEALGTAEILNRMHIPFRIVRDGDDFKGYKALIINNCAYIPPETCRQLRAFVSEGGTLIVTGETSLFDFDGHSTGNFQLADVAGVDFSGQYSDKITYSGEEQILASNPVPLCTARAGTEVRMTLSMPDFPARDPEKYASIHSDPPGRSTSFAAMTVNAFGRGRCVYLAAPILMLRQYTQQQFGMELFSEFLPQMLLEGSALHHSAELSLLKSPDDGSYMLCIVNMQNDLPPVPLTDIILTFERPGTFEKITAVSTGKEIPFEQKNGQITLRIPRIEYGEFFLFN